MSDVGQRERKTQDRVVRLFSERLGYRYLGNRQHRKVNSNIEEGELRSWLLGERRLARQQVQGEGGSQCPAREAGEIQSLRG